METAVENELPYSLSARWAPGLSEKVELRDFNLTEKENPTTDDRLALSELAAKREIVGLHIGPSEAEPFWTSFLRDLVRRIRLSLASEFNRNASRDLDPVGGSLGTEQCFELGGRLYHR